MKLIELMDSGILQDCKIAVFTKINAGTAEDFNVEIMRGDRPRGWREEYIEWLRAMDLEVYSVGIGVDKEGNNNTICLHCKPITIHHEEEDGCIKHWLNEDADDYNGLSNYCEDKSAESLADRLAVRLMRYMLEYVPWYHIKDGELVPGARSDMEALYKASDIKDMIEKIAGVKDER